MANANLQLTLSLRDKMKIGLDQAKANVNKGVGDMQKKMSMLKSSAAENLSALGAEIPQLGNAMGLVANPIGLAVAGITAVATGIAFATNKANDWHVAMAQINVTAGMTQKELAGLSDQLLDIGARNVAPLEEIPKAFNRIISAGLTVNQSMKALEPTLRAAKAGFTDIETVASAGIATMASSGEDINKVYDILFATVKSGNAEFKDIATYLPKIVPLAKNVGFALYETAGAYAALTTKLSAEQSSTALEGIMRSLSDTKVVGKFKKIGIDVFDFKTGKVKPMLDIAKKLETAMKGLTDKQRMEKMSSLGLDQASMVGFGVMIQDIKGLQTAIDASANSQGALNKAYLDSLSPMDSWKIVWNQIQVYIVKFGELFLPIMTSAGLAVLDVINYFKDLYNSNVIIRDIIEVIGLKFKSIFYFIGLGLKIVWAVFKFSIIDPLVSVWNLLVLVIKKTTGFSGSFTDLYLKVKPIMVYIYEILKSIGAIMVDIFTFKFAAAEDKIANFKFPNLQEITAKVMLDSATKKESDLSPDDKKPEGDKLPTASPINTDAKTIAGGGQAKNLTINIGSFIENFSTKNEVLSKMNLKEIEAFFTDMFMRMLRSGELAF